MMQLTALKRAAALRTLTSTLRQRQPYKCWERSLLTLSICSGPGEPPLLHQTVGSHLKEVAERYGDSTAVISRHQGQRVTYHELDQQSTELAHGFAKRGIRKGDRVAVSLGNNMEYALTTYALYKLGAILVPLNPSFNIQQVIASLTHLDAAYLVISLETNLPRKPPRSNIPLLQKLVPSLEKECVSEAVPSLKMVITVNNSYGRIDDSSLKAFPRFPEVFADGKSIPGEINADLDPDDVVNIQFTSGTTSMPKAACLTHKSILNNGNAIGDRMLLTNEDVVCCPPPLFHCFGAVLGYLACVTHGSAIVFPAESFNPVATLKAVQEEGCTALHGVPTMFIAELELLKSGEIEHRGFDKLRTGIAAGSSVPLELMKKLHQTLNMTELTICYGMTETSPVSFMTTTDDPMEKRLDSVGRILPHVDAKIVSPGDHTKILPIGEQGELAVAGYNVQQGYWNDPVKSAEAMKADGTGKVWMHTGDEAEMDEKGYIRITGRIKDLIIRGGENIHPLEIENCLLAHDSIMEASCVGLKDERYGEVVAAFVRRADGHSLRIDEVQAWVRERLSNHLVPKYVFWTEDFPKTASGKIQKFKLQELGESLRKETPELLPVR